MYLQLNSMGFKFEKIKREHIKNLTNSPIPGKPGQVRKTEIFLRLALCMTVHVCINDHK